MDIEMNMYTEPQIGAAVRSARCAAGLSAKQLAEQCQMLPTALSKVEGGKQKLSFGEAIEICRALGIRPDHLAALALEVEPLANEAANIKERLRRDLQILQQRTIRRAIAARKNEALEAA